MIVAIKLSGGLGNQFFQYAAGRSMALRHNAKLFIDKSFFAKSPNRKYVLDQFNIIQHRITKKEIITSYLNREQQLLDFFSKEIEIINSSEFKLVETGFSYNKNFEIVTPPILLDGYWQSEKYFSSISESLKLEFTLRFPLNIHVNILKDKIISSNSVAIHLRRGDYTTNKEINAIHGICDFDYYFEAFKELEMLVGDAFPFIFSDDKETAIEFQKKLGRGLIVSCEVITNDIEEFTLMSYCKHFIIANSTYSWWAAWLGNYNSKVVFAPCKWFKDSSKNDIDLIPLNWRRI